MTTWPMHGKWLTLSLLPEYSKDGWRDENGKKSGKPSCNSSYMLIVGKEQESGRVSIRHRGRSGCANCPDFLDRIQQIAEKNTRRVDGLRSVDSSISPPDLLRFLGPALHKAAFSSFPFPAGQFSQTRKTLRRNTHDCSFIAELYQSCQLFIRSNLWSQWGTARRTRGYSADIPCAEVVEELLPTVGAHAYEVGGLLVGGIPLCYAINGNFHAQLGVPLTRFAQKIQR